jgi:hypothetical protein
MVLHPASSLPCCYYAINTVIKDMTQKQEYTTKMGVVGKKEGLLT